MEKARLIIVNGLPATGKSTLADTLSRQLGIPVFKKDDFKEMLSDSTGLTDLESSKMFGKASYQILFFIAKQCLRNKNSLIIEGNFTPGEETQGFVTWLRKQDVDVTEVLCFAKGQMLVDRFSKRKRHSIHVLKATDLEHTLRTEKIPSLKVGRLFELDTSDFSKIPYDELIAFLKS